MVGDRYEYEWYDHYSNDGWQDPDDIPRAEPYVIKSIGILVGEDKHYLYFTDGVASNGVYRGIMAIFKAALKSKKKLK